MSRRWPGKSSCFMTLLQMLVREGKLSIIMTYSAQKTPFKVQIGMFYFRMCCCSALFFLPLIGTLPNRRLSPGLFCQDSLHLHLGLKPPISVDINFEHLTSEGSLAQNFEISSSLTASLQNMDIDDPN